MKIEEMEARALELVRVRQALNQPTEIVFRNHTDIMKGVLGVVTWKDGNRGNFVDSFVYFDADGDAEYFTSPIELARYLEANRPNSLFDSLPVGGLLDRVGIPGVIALMISVTLCVMAMTNGTRALPEPLTHAFTLILGYYFGTANLHQFQPPRPPATPRTPRSRGEGGGKGGANPLPSAVEKTPAEVGATG